MVSECARMFRYPTLPTLFKDVLEVDKVHFCVKRFKIRVRI